MVAVSWNYTDHFRHNGLNCNGVEKSNIKGECQVFWEELPVLIVILLEKQILQTIRVLASTLHFLKILYLGPLKCHLNLPPFFPLLFLSIDTRNFNQCRGQEICPHQSIRDGISQQTCPKCVSWYRAPKTENFRKYLVPWKPKPEQKKKKKKIVKIMFTFDDDDG